MLVNMVIESIPQLIVEISLIVSELETGFGKLGLLFQNILEAQIGLPGHASYVFLMCLNITTIANTLLIVFKTSKNGLELGIPATISRLLALCILIFSKLWLVSLTVYQTPYNYGIILVAESVFVIIYIKLTQDQENTVQDVIPLLAGPGLYDIEKRNINSPHMRKCGGLFNTILIHMANLILIYLPTKLILWYTSSYDGGFTTGYVVALVNYIVAVGPYIGMIAIFYKVGRRWDELEKTTKSPTTLHGDDNTKAS